MIFNMEPKTMLGIEPLVHKISSKISSSFYKIIFVIIVMKSLKILFMYNGIVHVQRGFRPFHICPELLQHSNMMKIYIGHILVVLHDARCYTKNFDGCRHVVLLCPMYVHGSLTSSINMLTMWTLFRCGWNSFNHIAWLSFNHIAWLSFNHIPM